MSPVVHSILWRYFDGVSRQLGEILDEDRTSHEPNLTWVLTQLVNDGLFARRLLRVLLDRQSV